MKYFQVNTASLGDNGTLEGTGSFRTVGLQMELVEAEVCDSPSVESFF